MKSLLSLIGIGWCLALANAQVVVRKTPAPAPDGQRILFLFDTSSSMEDLQTANEQLAYDLLLSGVDGFMRLGDTYGFWTFNKEVYAGAFPMQVWEPRRSAQLGVVAAAFLKDVKYEENSDMRPTMAALASVIRAVSNLTVFIITDGKAAMRGTPFDSSINSSYRKKARERSQAKKPFLTMLEIRDGWFVSSAVAVAGTPMTLPTRAAPLMAQATTVPPPKSAPARTASGELIVSAREAPPLPNAAPANNVASTTLASTSAAPSAVSTRPRVIQITTKSNPPPAVAGSAEPATASVTPDPSVLAGPPKPTNETKAPPPQASATPQPAASPPSTISLNSNAVPATVVSAATTALAAAPAPAALTVPARGPSIPAVASTSPAPETNGVSASQGPRPPEPSSASPTPASAPEAVKPARNVMEQESFAMVYLAFGASLLAATIFLLVLVLRRLRPQSQSSFITQSIERN